MRTVPKWVNKIHEADKIECSRHSEAVQCLAYNPVTFHLASCALSDFAFWSTDVKAVQKYRVSGRITCCAWSANGQHLAIGLASGMVSIRDKLGDEIQKIVRDAAVWAVAFSKNVLLITDWNETLSFYNIAGQQIWKERYIGIAALSIHVSGALVLVGGIGGWSVLTSEGVIVLTTELEWVWSIAPSPSFGALAVGCQDGSIWCYQVVFNTVHGLFREKYAYRENMTDVIIQHLASGNKVRIKCHDTVHKIAIYKHRLAVQLPERVLIYEQTDSEGMMYKVKEKLVQKAECSLLVTTSTALLLCQDTKLTMVGSRSWDMPAPIRYVKVSTLHLEEVLLLGLMNGQIWQIEPTRGEMKMLVQTGGAVRCVDVSAGRSRLAVVDEGSVCRVYGVPRGDLLYTEENVSSVSWNLWFDELLCFSGGGLLSIKVAHFPAATQPLAGSVVGFQGGRVFCLQSSLMQTIKVPLSHAVHQYVQQKMFHEAYAVACLGVTACDWERLGMAALEELSFEVARKALQRSENIVYLTLIDHLEERLSAGEERAVVSGEVLAQRGRFAAAASSYRGAGAHRRALDMYVELRMFSKAQEVAEQTGGADAACLTRLRAEWARRVDEPRAAADMYLAAGDVRRAAAVLRDSGKTHM
ncbi:intraflagellar transport protein 122 homolog [Leptidea sinapis]|uniref:intraflagellar transport protein 122 homolog n=1 Tax=Leptidea sinapis TaxID=189913 RepID=UPI0021C365A4|nr:intraflagellar transport protein 122 homolog [Leptidea sinapis]